MKASELDKRIITLLNDRGYKTDEEIEEFLNPTIDILRDPFKLKGMKEAKERIENAILNNVEERIEFIVSNLFENIGQKQFDYIVSNPPYIETSVIQTLSKEVQNEPKLALDGGEDGLKFYKEILKNAYKYLLPDGYLILEIGYNQAEKIINTYKENFENKSNKSSENLILETKNAIKDLGGNDRVLIFKK